MDYNRAIRDARTPTQRRPLQEISNIQQQESSPCLPVNRDPKPQATKAQLDDVKVPQPAIYTNPSRASTHDGSSSSVGDSSPTQQYEYRRQALAKGQDSRRFNEYPPTEPAPKTTTIPVELNKRFRKTHVGPWRLGKTLGTGSSGRIRLARHDETMQLAAVKIMAKERIQESWMEDGVECTKEKWTNQMEREVIIMKMIRHPHIVGMIEVYENKFEL